MSQNWSDDTYEPSNVVITDAQKIENNFNVLKTTFYGSSTPSNAENGQTWCYTGDATYYYYRQYLNGWRDIFRVHKSTYKVEAVNCTGTLNAYNTGNSSGNIPLSNGTVNTNLNSDLLDGQHGSYYQNSSNQNSGTLSADRIADLSLSALKIEGGCLNIWMPWTPISSSILTSWSTSSYLSKTRGWISNGQNFLIVRYGLIKSGGGYVDIRIYINGVVSSYNTHSSQTGVQEGALTLYMNSSTRGGQEIILEVQMTTGILEQDYVYGTWN